ncbi:MAG: Lar family restriction alleviation protein [Rikenellaceae bacterium]
MNGNLKPCPFCGKEQVTLEYQVKLTPTSLFHTGVFCRYCGGAVIRIDITDAIIAWNTRQTEAETIDGRQPKYT